MVIAIDIDDTITNSNKVVRKYMTKYIKETHSKDSVESIIRGTTASGPSVQYYRDHCDVIGNEIKVKPGAASVIKKLHDEGNKIIIVTARSENYYKDCYEFCVNYLNRNGIVFDELYIGQIFKTPLYLQKKVDLVIDDAVDTIDESVNLGLRAILFTSSINREFKTLGKRLNNWTQVYNYIKKIKKVV